MSGILSPDRKGARPQRPGGSVIARQRGGRERETGCARVRQLGGFLVPLICLAFLVLAFLALALLALAFLAKMSGMMTISGEMLLEQSRTQNK